VLLIKLGSVILSGYKFPSKYMTRAYGMGLCLRNKDSGNGTWGGTYAFLV